MSRCCAGRDSADQRVSPASRRRPEPIAPTNAPAAERWANSRSAAPVANVAGSANSAASFSAFQSGSQLTSRGTDNFFHAARAHPTPTAAGSPGRSNPNGSSAPRRVRAVSYPPRPPQRIPPKLPPATQPGHGDVKREQRRHRRFQRMAERNRKPAQRGCPAATGRQQQPVAR